MRGDALARHADREAAPPRPAEAANMFLTMRTIRKARRGAIACLFVAGIGCAGANQPAGFADALTIEAIGRINAIAVGELNSDGRPDIAAVSGEPGRLLILLNQGEGRFDRAGEPIAVTPPASGVVAGDFNEDGRQDLVVASHDGDAVEAFFGRGDGSFDPARSIPLMDRKAGIPHVHNIASGDFNRDGHLDIVIAQSEDNAIIVALGDGKGGFAPAGPPTAVGDHPYRVTVADFNGDGNLDVGSPNARSNDLTIVLGDGRGGLSRVAGEATALQREPLGLDAAGDLNGDGHVDLVGKSDVELNALAVLLGDGTGRFTRHRESLQAPARTYGQVIVDINGDGMADVVSPSIHRSSVFIWLAREPAELRFEFMELKTPGTDSQVAAVADLNGDGVLDIVTGGWERATLAVILGRR